MIRRPRDHSDFLARGELPAGGDQSPSTLDPEAEMRRRDFLLRTAALAGGVGLASLLPAERLVAEAAKRQARVRLPSPQNMPIDTVVVLMMENRSFDHYFGWHPTADAKNVGLSYPDANGQPVPTHHLTPDFQGCAFRDPDHSWEGGRWQYHHGRLDGFVQGNREGTGSDSFAAGYYLKDDLGFIPHAADAYTLYDRWFCSIMASTFPNRHYQLGAQSGGQVENEIPKNPQGNQWETIFDRALSRGLTARYYASDQPFAALYGPRGIGWTHPVSEFYSDAAAGKLPNIAFVDPMFVGEGDGISGDEHPHGDIRVGQAFMSDITHAFIQSPQYRRGVMFIDYDEWGGFFDHVKPKFVPDDRATRKLADTFGLTGFRTPGVAVSPFTRSGGVSHLTVTHESILKLISYRFGIGHLNTRHRYASNIARSFDFANPDYEVPDLPDPTAIAGRPCALQLSGPAPARAQPHDMALLETSGLLDRLGYEVPPPTFDRVFREPDSVAGALKASGAR